MSIDFNALEAKQQAKSKGFAPQPKASRTDNKVGSIHTQNAAAANSAIAAANQQTRGAVQGHLANVTNYCDRVESQRDSAAEQISDRIAYMLDPDVFMAEVLERAAAKLGKSQPESWVNPFEDVTIKVPKFQSIQESSIAAQLPSSSAS